MTEPKIDLSDREYERLKDLVESGRKYHYRNFVFASLVVVLLLKDESESLKLILDVELPVRILMVVLYFATIVYTIITIDILKSIYKIIRYNYEDSIPFNWFVLTGKQTRFLSGFWVILPMIICYVGIAYSKIPINKGFLFYFGLFGTFMPTLIKNFAYNISRKVDNNGKKISFSIYLLYWYRFIRNVLFIIFFSLPIVYFFDPSNSHKNINNVFDDYIIVLVSIPIIMVVRIIAELFYKKINKFGMKYGFEKEYIK